MDEPDEVHDSPTVGSSTIQVVDSSTPTDNIDMLLPEGNAMFEAAGVIMEDCVLPGRGDYMEPDQTDRNMGESSNNFVGSSGQPSSQPDDEASLSHVDDDMAASGQISSSSSRNVDHLRGGRDVEDSQSPQAVPEVDIFEPKPSSSENDQVASSSISADETSLNSIEVDALQSQVSSGGADLAHNSTNRFAMDSDSMADGVSMQDGELQVVPDSGGSLVSKQPDTSTSWSSEAVTSGNSEQEQSAEAQVRYIYPTTSEAQMVPVSSNTLQETREADMMNSEQMSQESGYLSQQHEVSHSEMEDVIVQLSDTSQVHVSSSQSQNLNEALSSTEGVFRTLDNSLDGTGVNEMQATHSGMNHLSNVVSSENIPVFVGSSADPAPYVACEASDVCGETPDSNRSLLVTCGDDENDAMYASHISSQSDGVASSSRASYRVLPSLVSSNMTGLVQGELQPIALSSTDSMNNASEATASIENSTIAGHPDQSVPVDISNEARCTTPSRTDEIDNLNDDNSDASEVAGPTESSQLMADSGMMSDSTVHSYCQAEQSFSQTNNEAAHLENDNRYVSVSNRGEESRLTAYLSQTEELPAEPDSGSTVAEATREDLGPCDGSTSITMDEEDVDQTNSPEEGYAFHLQHADSGSEAVTYLVQEGHEGAETFRIVTEQQLKQMQAEEEMNQQTANAEQELTESNLHIQSTGQQYIVEARGEDEDVVLHLPGEFQAAESGSHLIALDCHDGHKIQVVESIPETSHILSPTTSYRRDIERQNAAVLSTRTTTDCGATLLRPIAAAATVNTTCIRTPIPAEVEAPSPSKRSATNFTQQTAQPEVQQIVYQDLRPEFQIIPSGTHFPTVTRPGQSILRPLVPQSILSMPSFQPTVKIEPTLEAEVIYEPREEIQVLNNVAYEPVPSTIIQQALAAEGVLDADEQQPLPIKVDEDDLSGHLTTMATAQGEVIQAEQYERLEIDAHPPQVIDIGNTGGNALSADNMQALLQILQALPFSAQGQTVQIVLQGGSSTTSTTLGQEIYQVAEFAATQQPKEQVLHLVQMANNANVSPSKTMADMAVQVGPAEATEMILSDVAAFHRATTPTVRGRMSAARGGRRGSRRPVGRTPTTMKYRPYSDPEGDGKSSVNYYAVMDYLSEQEGYSSSQDISQHEAPSSGFMEDHLELQSDTDGFQNRSLLESTLDQTTIVSPYRRKGGRYKVLAVNQPGTSIDLPTLPSQASVTLQEKSYEQAQIEGKDLSEQTYDDGDPTSRPPRYTRGLGPIQQRKPNHRCGYCDYQSRDRLLTVQHCELEHPDHPVKTILLMPRCTRRQCPYCKQDFNHAEFFQHMRYTHNEVHPYKCYYCDFQARDRNQVKHHICKKHAKPPKIVNLLKEPNEPSTLGRRRIMALSEGEDSVYEYLTDDDDEEEWDETMDRRNLTCPECKKTFKSLKYLKTHIKMHWPHRYQCGYCDYIATLEHQILKHSIRKHGSVEPKIISRELEPEKNPLVSRNIEDIMNKVFSLSMRKPRDPDSRKWARKWACPHCDYTCQFGASFRRHIRMHANLLPYKCNYCSFKGREKYYVRRHIARMHRGLPEIVVENTAENRACDTSSDEDFQAKGLRRRRRRRTKRVLKAIVPVATDPTLAEACLLINQDTDNPPAGDITAVELQPRKKSVPDQPQLAVSLDFARYHKGNGIENMDLSQTSPVHHKEARWVEKKIEHYSETHYGATVVCKVCGLKIHTDTFYKHARKHFKVKPFKCGYCNYMAIERAKVRVHITFHHPLLPFKIEECDAWSLSPHDINKVFVDTCEAQQWKPVEVTFTCPICQEKIDGEERSLREHLYIHYDYKPYKCTSCAMTFPSHEAARTHLAADHEQESVTVLMDEDFPEEIENTIQQLLKEIEEAKIMEAIPYAPLKRKRGRPPKLEKNPNMFQCPICDRQLKCHTATIRRHFYSHYEYKPFVCGYCAFKATSDNEVKQHISSHGNVPCNIMFSEESMPPKLEKILTKFLDAISLAPRPAQLTVPTPPISGSETMLQTDEGRRWKDVLTKGTCPWCDQKIGHFRPTAYRHLKQHFKCHPYKCGHCTFRGAERLEIKEHIMESHSGWPVAIIGPTFDVEETEVGLRRFLWCKSYQVAYANTTQKHLSTNGKHSGGLDIQKNGSIAQQQWLQQLPANFRTNKPLRLVPRKETYHSDTEILEGNDNRSFFLGRAYKSENDSSNDSSEAEDKMTAHTKLPTWALQDSHIPEDFVVPRDLLQDVLYLLKISSLPHDTPMFKRKSDWHKCSQCRRRFRKYGALKQHIEHDHAVEAPSYFCCYCDYCHTEQRKVKSHIIRMHPGRRLLIKEKVNKPKSGASKRHREEDMAYIARVYREPKKLKVERETDDEDREEMATNEPSEMEKTGTYSQRYPQAGPQVKRKRGRPRKNSLPISDTSFIDTSIIDQLCVKQEVVSDSFVGESSTQENTKEVVVHVTVTQAYPPRRRGRPRKYPVPVITTPVVSGNLDNQQHDEKSLQINDNIQIITNNPVQIINTTPLTPRKRGRPRKYAPLSESTVTTNAVPVNTKITSETKESHFVVVDKSLETVFGRENAQENGVETSVVDASSSALHDILVALEASDSPARQDNTENDFEAVVLQLANVCDGEYKYKLQTRSGMEPETIRIFGTPPRIFRQKISKTGVEEEEVLGGEALEHLKECDENLPKILKILSLRPSK